MSRTARRRARRKRGYRPPQLVPETSQPSWQMEDDLEGGTYELERRWTWEQLPWIALFVVLATAGSVLIWKTLNSERDQLKEAAGEQQLPS